MSSGPGDDHRSIAILDAPGHEPLLRVLLKAYEQSAAGKGKERHAQGRAFLDQPIMTIQQQVGTSFALGQAIKKLQESQRLPTNAALAEILGAIVYCAAAYLHRERLTK